MLLYGDGRNGLQDKSVPRMIIVFDVEGVLVDGEFLPELAKLVGKEKKVHDITLSGIRGEIDWEEGLRQRIELVKGVSYEDCVRVSNRLPLMRGAVEMAEKLRERDCIMVGVTGGFSLLGNRVKSALTFDHVFSNELVFHHGKLIGYGLLVNANKAQILNTAFGEMLQERRKVAVVDGANDIDLFGIADLKIAFNAQRVVREKADVIVDGKDLREIPKIISETTDRPSD